jgi:hypothetical protein
MHALFVFQGNEQSIWFLCVRKQICQTEIKMSKNKLSRHESITCFERACTCMLTIYDIVCDNVYIHVH